MLADISPYGSVAVRERAPSFNIRQQTSACVSIRRETHTRSDSGMDVGLQWGKSAVELAEEGNRGRGHSEVLTLLCQHGARGALWYAAKKDLRDMLAELISKGHDLEERDQVPVYEALSCAQVLVYEALSDLEECDKVHFSA